MVRSAVLTELVSTKTFAEVDQARARFLNADPFPHVVIDEFLTPEFADELLADFPRKDAAYEKFCIMDDGRIGNNYANSNPAEFPLSFNVLDKLIKDPSFLSLVSEITGIPALQYDPDYIGGGIRESAAGNFLPPHIDFNHHPRTLSHRRLNLLLYLNKDWECAWGGNLQVHKDPRGNPASLVHSYTPLFNRCLIFETSENSWHAFDRLTPPHGRARRAFTVYFYTKERPGSDSIKLHNTEYVEPPLPAHITAGYTLTKDDIELLREGYARRDGRISMLYALRREADSKIAHIWQEYEYYLNAWKKATGQS